MDKDEIKDHVKRGELEPVLLCDQLRVRIKMITTDLKFYCCMQIWLQ